MSNQQKNQNKNHINHIVKGHLGELANDFYLPSYGVQT